MGSFYFEKNNHLKNGNRLRPSLRGQMLNLEYINYSFIKVFYYWNHNKYIWINLNHPNWYLYKSSQSFNRFILIERPFKLSQEYKHHFQLKGLDPLKTKKYLSKKIIDSFHVITNEMKLIIWKYLRRKFFLSPFDSSEPVFYVTVA